MNEPNSQPASTSNPLLKLLSAIGPGLFVIGYIIGTGSVTSLAKAGASYGMSLTWALALSCIGTYVLLVSISRVTIASNTTLIRCIRQNFGAPIAILLIVGLMATVVPSVIGVMGIVSDVVRVFTARITGGNGIHPVVTAAAFSFFLYVLFWLGSHRLFLRAMAIIVAMMAISFITAMFLVIPGPAELIAGLKPIVPVGGNGLLDLAAMIGTTMASVCVVTRTYLVAEQGWTLKDLKSENRDAIVSLTLTFIVSGAIMACAAGTMHKEGLRVEQAIDMVQTLEPLAGRFATTVFVAGIIAAALSSLFPNYLLGPWLVCDFSNTPRRMDRPSVRVAVALVASLGFVVPIFNAKPVLVMLASQAISPVVMPLLIVLLAIMLNRKKIVGEYKNPVWLNVALGVTMLFALFASYAAVIGLLESIRQLTA